MIRFLKIFGVLLLLVLLFITVQKIFLKSSAKKEVLKFANEMNKTCPSMIDRETRLDKVIAFDNNNLQFNYTLINMVRDSLPISALKNYMRPLILNKIKNSEPLKKLLDNNLTWIYSYKDRRGDFIFKLTYTPEQISSFSD
jgi:hypothetical protein